MKLPRSSCRYCSHLRLRPFTSRPPIGMAASNPLAPATAWEIVRIALVFLFTTFVAPTAFAGDNQSLQKITDADQADRRGGPDGIDPMVVRARDLERERSVLEIIRAGGLSTSTDYFNAALVFQHAESTEDVALAHSLATMATRIEPVHPNARWLAAASWDRLMMRRKKPQWYGTQFVKRAFGKWELYTVDESAVSDEERERQNVPRLAVSKERARKMNDD